ncbi:transposase [Streptomyces sp. NPDC057717]|uniref:transposase n=1 Tax=Streptomyces sp. NPDC057717 TaxID=3346224 RepID=UPI0036AABC3D
MQISALSDGSPAGLAEAIPTRQAFPRNVSRPLPASRTWRARLATPTGRAQYRQRSALVEPGFAQIFQRFGRHLNYRGRPAVDAEIKLLGTVHNLNKLINHAPGKRS